MLELLFLTTLYFFRAWLPRDVKPGAGGGSVNGTGFNGNCKVRLLPPVLPTQLSRALQTLQI